MAAQSGNKLWMLRHKHGRNTLFSTPELMWEAACDYFKWCDNHPWEKEEAVKSGPLAGKTVKVPTQTPYSINGFLIYIGAGRSYWSQFKGANHEDFKEVIERIEMIIETQQFEGAVVGAFNANIISRKLGLHDKTEITYIPPSEPVDTKVIFENYNDGVQV